MKNNRQSFNAQQNGELKRPDLVNCFMHSKKSPNYKSISHSAAPPDFSRDWNKQDQNKLTSLIASMHVTKVLAKLNQIGL